MSEPSRHVVFGCSGPIGVELMRLLHERGRRVRGISRRGVAHAPAGVEVVVGDAADVGQARHLCQGADVVYCCIGIPYPQWSSAWPSIVHGLIEACAHAGAKLVLADNLYAYGPVNGPLREDLPGTTYGVKPALRARLAQQLLDAHSSGRLRVAIGRAADFYGPRVLNAALGSRVFAAALKGARAGLLGDIDQPHTYTYAPDFARALATLGEHDEAFGEIWHVPSAPARPTREVVEMIYRLAGKPPRMAGLPRWVIGLIAPFVPLMGELREMMFQWDRPYYVDHGKFARAFYGDYTPLEDGLAATLDWCREHCKQSTR